MAEADFPIYSRAVLADSAARHHGSNFATDLRAIAEQIRADVEAGRKVMTEHGVFTHADLAAAVRTEGGVFYPTLSCGPDADAALKPSNPGGHHVDRGAVRASILIGEAGLSEERTGPLSGHTVSPHGTRRDDAALRSAGL